MLRCGDLRCFVARQFLSQIYALLSVKCSGLKICWCKKKGQISGMQLGLLSLLPYPPLLLPWVRQACSSHRNLDLRIGRRQCCLPWVRLLLARRHPYSSCFILKSCFWHILVKRLSHLGIKERLSKLVNHNLVSAKFPKWPQNSCKR